MKAKILLAMILCLFGTDMVAEAQSPQDSIQIGVTTLRLGATQVSVLQQLGDYYALQENEKNDENGSSWMVVSKTQPQLAYANIYFKDGKLASVYKYWDVEEPNTEAGLANAMFGAISGFEREE